MLKRLQQSWQVRQAGRHTIEPELNFAHVLQKRLWITGSALRPRSVEEKGRVANALREQVWPLLASGRCLPVIDSTFPLAEAAAAHRRMESGEHIGKIVLRIGV